MRLSQLALAALLLSTSALAGPLDPFRNGSPDLGDDTGDRGGEELIFPTNDGPMGIWNGQDTSEHPAVIALVAYHPTQSYVGVFCSGTIVSRKWVITAAHCVDAFANDYAGWDIYISFNNRVYEQSWNAIQVKRGIMHPQYNESTISNDIAVVELVSQVYSVTPMTVNDEGLSDLDAGNIFHTFVGYGVTGDGRNDGGIKRKTQINFQGCMDPGFQSLVNCGSSSAQVMYSESSNTNVCQGDSGGAALENQGGNWELVGVNSFVTPSCINGGNGAVRVDKFLPWIRQYITDLDTTGGGFGDTDTDTDTDSETDTDTDTDTDTSPPDPDDWSDTGWEPAGRPSDDQYLRPAFGFCSSVPSAPGGAAWLGLAGLIGLVRRRR